MVGFGLGVRLGVDADDGFSVGLAEVDPALREVDFDAVAVVDFVVGVGGFYFGEYGVDVDSGAEVDPVFGYDVVGVCAAEVGRGELGLTMNILSICIMLVVYGRMIEVYLTVSVGPIPLATMTNREWGGTGQNYLKSLFALGFQAFLIMVCVGIYSVLVQNIGVGGNVSTAIWACMGYTVLLCFALFKTGSLSKSLFGAH